MPSPLRIAGIIPARLGSTRLARKVLRPIAGRPMVEWVWRAAAESGLMDPVLVATDSEEVAAACKQRGMWPMTHFNRLHVVPPCTTTEQEVREGLAILDEALEVADQHYTG